jgi:hypothetical protein
LGRRKGSMKGGMVKYGGSIEPKGGIEAGDPLP